jgi:hypothetical protein
VVNNGIVLIDYIDLTRKRKREELGLPEDAFLPAKIQIEALVEAGRTRLRPVMLTAITTVLGLVPLAVGLNFDFLQPLHSFRPEHYHWRRECGFLGANVMDCYFWVNICYCAYFGDFAGNVHVNHQD